MNIFKLEYLEEKLYRKLLMKSKKCLKMILCLILKLLDLSNLVRKSIQNFKKGMIILKEINHLNKDNYIYNINSSKLDIYMIHPALKPIN